MDKFSHNTYTDNYSAGKIGKNKKKEIFEIIYDLSSILIVFVFKCIVFSYSTSISLMFAIFENSIYFSFLTTSILFLGIYNITKDFEFIISLKERKKT